MRFVLPRYALGRAGFPVSRCGFTYCVEGPPLPSTRCLMAPCPVTRLSHVRETARPGGGRVCRLRCVACALLRSAGLPGCHREPVPAATALLALAGCSTQRACISAIRDSSCLKACAALPSCSIVRAHARDPRTRIRSTPAHPAPALIDSPWNSQRPADPVTPSAAALGRLLLRWDVLYRYRYEASIPKSVRGGYFFAPAFCAAAQTQKSPVVQGLCWGGAAQLADGAGVVGASPTSLNGPRRRRALSLCHLLAGISASSAATDTGVVSSFFSADASSVFGGVAPHFFSTDAC